MNKLIALTIFLISIPAASEEIQANGKKYTIETKSKILQCGTYSVTKYERSLPFSIRESRIPYKITIGHHGRPHLLSLKLTYKSKSVEKTIPALEKLLTGYNRISSKKSYISTPVKCISKNKVIFKMWGGGNCTNVCEAWATIEFSKSGEISSIKGLSYREFIQLQKNN